MAEVGTSAPDQTPQAQPETDQNQTKPLHVFVAHRHEDISIIRKAVRQIEHYCADKVQFLLSEDIPIGIDWRDWIKQNIAVSNQLWVVYTDPTGNWEWPLYEAGIFTGLKGEGVDSRLVCFYRNTREKPDALANYEGVQIEQDELKDFLRKFYGEAFLPGGSCINSTVAGDNDCIVSIVEAILPQLQEPPRVEPEFFNKIIELSFSFLGKSVEDDDIKNAKVYSLSYVRDIFAAIKLPNTWEDLLSDVNQFVGERSNGDAEGKKVLEQWSNELHDALKKACQDRVFDQPYTLFVGLNSDRKFLPILHSVKKVAVSTDPPETTVRAQILFLERKPERLRAPK